MFDVSLIFYELLISIFKIIMQIVQLSNFYMKYDQKYIALRTAIILIKGLMI